MNYFISENIFAFNSGTEHSQAKRTLLFNKMGASAKYVTRDYNRFLARNAATLGLDRAQVLNMYDFFQGRTDVVRVEQPLRLLKQIPLDHYHIVSDNPNYSVIQHAGVPIARVNVMPATVGLVGDITYYDRFGNSTVRENWDWRGFRSSIDYFHPNGQLGVRRILNAVGETVIEITHMNVDGKLQPTMWKLLNYKGHNFRFNTEDQLFLFFLNERLMTDPEALVISDRRSLDYVLADVSAVHNKWAYLHDIHVVNEKEPLKGRLFEAYVPVLESRAKDFAGVFVATEAQKHDIEQRFPKLTVVVAPDTVVNQARLDVGLPPEPKQDHHILWVGRLSPERRPEEALKAFTTVVKNVSDATLEFRGYPASAAYLTELKQLADQLGVIDDVSFGEYVTGQALAKRYQNAAVLLQTASGEGFGMTITEGFSYGVPAVAYDVRYGIKDQIRDGENGFLVQNGSTSILAARLTEILTNDALRKAMRQSAFDTAQTHTEKAVFKAWKQAFGS
ncbi:glycosyltransferase [uncultured Secundilactobacillus sp.]|uniref:glycosyltransferase n=1 Tax=uncultured Secundilactobacillus sp. TaxID=2813935 RepID=UPI002586F795|nr:glycosyltransferase [uncultured Secundilactobacillus sp.]